MKSKDLLPIVGVVIIAAILSFVLSNMIFSNKKTSTLKVEKVAPITADFPLPNEKYFNKDSYNPTKQIKIGEDNNKTPFK